MSDRVAALACRWQRSARSSRIGSRPATCPILPSVLYSPFGSPRWPTSYTPAFRLAVPRAPSAGFQCSMQAEAQTERESTVSVISMKPLLEAGVHFGHRTRRWHPKMRTFIFTERNGIHIIDLQQTMRQVNTAYARRPRHRARGRPGALRRHQEAGAGDHPAGSRALRHALRRRPAGWAAR